MSAAADRLPDLIGMFSGLRRTSTGSDGLESIASKAKNYIRIGVIKRIVNLALETILSLTFTIACFSFAPLAAASLGSSGLKLAIHLCGFVGFFKFVISAVNAIKLTYDYFQLEKGFNWTTLSSVLRDEAV